jgi:hypothetical protein
MRTLTPPVGVQASAREGWREHWFLAAWLAGFSGRIAVIDLLLCLKLPPFISIHEGDRVEWTNWLSNVIYDVPLGVVTGAQAPLGCIPKEVHGYPAWLWINAHLLQEIKTLR